MPPGNSPHNFMLTGARINKCLLRHIFISLVNLIYSVTVIRVVCVLLILSFSAGLRAQEKNIVINDFVRDTTAISAIVTKAREFRHKATDSGIALYYQGLQKSRQIGYVDGLARSLTGLGLFYMDKGDYNKSIAFYHLARPYCEKSTYRGGALIVALYNNIAALYGNRGIFDSAVQYYSKSLQAMQARNIRDTNLLLLIYSNIGGRLVMDDQLDQAEFYLEKGLAIAQQADNKPMLAKIYNDIATMHATKRNFILARLYADKALEIFKVIKDPASEIAANCIIGGTYREEKQPARALTYYLRAFRDSAGRSKTQLAVAYRGLAQCYYDLKQFGKAEQIYLEGLEISKAARLNKSMMESYRALASIYGDLGNYKLALQYRNLYTDMRDSTVNAERIKTVNDMEVRYRTSEKDKELALQQLLLNKREVQIREKNTAIGVVAGGGILIIALIGAIYRSHKHKERLRIISLEKEKEVAKLRATISGEEKERVRIARELHDGIMVQFSSVQMNMSALIEKSDSKERVAYEEILTQLEEVTKELRKSAHNLMPDMLLKEGLAEATHYFCRTLQRSAGLQIDFQMIGEPVKIAGEYELMIYRIIQELLQNILKHAKAKHALVQLNWQPDLLSIVVEDNGSGLEDKNILDKGLGLKGIETRVNSLNGHLSVTSEKGEGTSVYIELEVVHLQRKMEEANV